MTKMMNSVTTDTDASLLDEAVLDRLMEQVDAEGLQLLGPDGVLTELTSRLLNRAMAVELTEHLGYAPGAGRGPDGNARNGTTPKTVLTDEGALPLAIPRDREGTFTPAFVPKGVHRTRAVGLGL